ncbi:MAG: acyltransferase family protein [Angustibacter sp.]
MTDVRTAPARTPQARPATPDRDRERHRPTKDVFRPDIEGLRTVAIGTVLLYHAGISYLPGGFIGVDVFFVISGFLITSLLLRELRTTGTISLVRFYARRAKRLLPATGVVLAATVVLTALFLPRISWRSIGMDVIAAATYVVNWRLAAESVDYLNEDQAVSPVQQFWSLAVEEQYYIVWPVLLLVAVGWFRYRARRGGRGEITTGPLWIGLALIAVPSFLWSVHLTADQPSVAFFVTTTRMWELAIGAALAVGATGLRRLPRLAAVVVGWGGLAVIAGSALVIKETDPWPGYLALLPTLGTAAVIAAGPAAGRGGPVALLGTRPFVWVGGLSYSLYLWHWPLVVVATEYWGGLTGVQGLAVVAASFVPAYLSLRLVENPFRYAPVFSRLPRRALAVGAAFTVVGVLVGVGLRAAVPQLGVAPGSAQAKTARGAGALGSDPTSAPAGVPVDRVEWITPDPLEAPKDVPVAYADDCQQDVDGTKAKACVYGNPDGATTVALVGDSKVLQWLPAIQEIAAREQWRVLVMTKSACSLADAEFLVDESFYDACVAWNTDAMRFLERERPEVVVTSGGRRAAVLPGTYSKSAEPAAFTPGRSGVVSAGGRHPALQPGIVPLSTSSIGDDESVKPTTQAMVEGLVRQWSRLTEIGSRVVVLRDNPSPGFNVYRCVAENFDQLPECTFSRSKGEQRSGGDAQLAAVREFDDAALVDLNDYICPRDRCAPVIGNVLVYRQGSHITASYIRTLAPVLGEQLIPLVRRAPG